MDNNHTQNFNHLEYTVIRSNRKSICIEISPDLQIKVRAPQRMPDSQIRAFVVSKNKWITDHLAIMRKRLENQAADTSCKPLSDSELATLAQNASSVIPEPLFWAEVEKVLPNYKELRKELRQYSC